MTTNVLILCPHNSARSVLAEGMLNAAKKLGKDVHAFRAGSTPSGRINPLAIEALQEAGVDTPEAERPAAFEKTRQAISDRTMKLLQLPIEALNDDQLQRSLRALAPD